MKLLTKVLDMQRAHFGPTKWVANVSYQRVRRQCLCALVPKQPLFCVTRLRRHWRHFQVNFELILWLAKTLLTARLSVNGRIACIVWPPVKFFYSHIYIEFISAWNIVNKTIYLAIYLLLLGFSPYIPASDSQSVYHYTIFKQRTNISFWVL